MSQAHPYYYIHVGKARDLTDPKERLLYRMLEMVPGVLLWGTFFTVIFLSFTEPSAVAILIILIDVFWLVNSLNLSIFIVLSFVRMKKARRTDWFQKLGHLDQGAYTLPSLERWQDMIHLIILPMVKEGLEIVEPTIRALIDSTYPKENFFVVLAIEERAGESAERIASEIRERYSRFFGRFAVTRHPDNLAGEIAGKGANESWAAREAIKLLIDPARIPHERVLVSAFDVDTRVYPQYFACLTYRFLTTLNPLRKSYQPIPLFNNNIWEAPFFSRVAAIGSTMWQLFLQGNQELLGTFSSHSMSLVTLEEIGFWNKRVVSEDSIIFMQCFLAYDGDYKVVPLYYPVSMDANVSHSFVKTVLSVYRQVKRWAYGVENVPYMIFGFLKNKNIPRYQKIRRAGRTVFGFWSWACASVLIAVLGWLPFLVGGEEFRTTVLAFNLPRLTSRLLSLALFGLLVNGVLTFLLLPPKPSHISRHVYFTLLVQWLVLPVTFIFLSALPAIESQTRLMFGKYLGFQVTEKVRKKFRAQPMAESQATHIH